MKTVYLHVGPHKTGTTHVQKVFHENSEYFLKNYSVDYPKDYKIIFGHHELITQLKMNTFNENQLREVVDLSVAESIFLSSENFDVLSESEVETLLSALSCYNVKVIAMYREPSLRLYSWWQEEIKHGALETYPEYALPHLSRPMISDIFNLDVVLSRYSKFLKAESILVGNYEAFISGVGIEEFFEEILHVKFPPVPAESRFINKGLASFDIEMIRVLNCIALCTNGTSGSEVRETYLKNKPSINSTLLKSLKEKFNVALFDAEIGDLFQDRAVYQDFSKKYQIISPADFKRSSLNTIKEIPRNNWYLQDDVHSKLNEVFAQIFKIEGEKV